MPGVNGVNICDTTRTKIVRLLFAHWKPSAIAARCHVSPETVYLIERKLDIYGTARPPPVRRKGRPSPITAVAREKLFNWLTSQPWRYQDEMATFLWEEEGIDVTRRTIGNLLKREGWTRKKAERRSRTQSHNLRVAWRSTMSQYRAH